MSFSPAISTDKAKAQERRRSSREVLNHYVVIVYFGEDNWGKLTNMSERGMAFEFAKPPALGERVNFTFQVMGCMPVPPDASVLGESFEAAGEIVWLREFERTAGVQFVDLAEGNRKHIRHWLSFEATATVASGVKVKPEVLPLVAEATATTELPVSPTAVTREAVTEEETASEVDTKETLAEPDAPQSLAEPDREPESELAIGMPEEPPPTSTEEEEAVEWQPHPDSSGPSPASVARLTLLVVSGCLAAFVVTAGVRMYMGRTARHAQAAEGALGPARGEPIGAASVSSPFAFSDVPAVSPSEAAPPFQVEILDANGKRWMLWFVHKDANKGNDQTAGRTGTASPGFSASAAGKGAAPRTPRTFELAAPNLNRPEGNDSAANNALAEAPGIETELTVPPGEASGGVLDSRVTPPSPALNTPIGGMVQQARLIHSVPPVYPSVAKSTRVSGDVVVDALIDASGNVKSARVLSGPIMLRQAAIETVRQWKYEPARLDGQAVAMHLTVTVKFRLN